MRPFRSQPRQPPREAIQKAEWHISAGDTEKGQRVLAEAIRNGGWSSSMLWWELKHTMREASDFRRIESLWREAPTMARRNDSICRAVARAAALAGHHATCQRILTELIDRVERNRRRGSSFAERIHALIPARSSRTQPVRPDAPSFADSAAKALHDLKAAFETIDADMFLVSGTLLGCIRDNAIIAWDKDIDVGVMSNSVPSNLRDRLGAHLGFTARAAALNRNRILLKHRSGVGLDVFPHYREDGRVWHDGVATRWWNSPFDLEPVQFLGEEHLVPAPPERYLEENYGDWKTPVKAFDAKLDAPNVEITDADHFRSLLYFGLLRSLRKGKQEAADRYRRRIAELDNDG